MNSAKTLKNILSVICVIVIINTFQTYLLYQTRKFGDINFFDVQDHIFGLLLSFISFACTYLAWKFVTLKYKDKIIRIGFTFFMALLLFCIFTTLFYVIYRYLLFGFSTSLWMMVGNIVAGVIMHHLYISGYTIAYLHFTGAKELAVNIEKLEKEKEIFKSRMIQKSLEPHFLFNNLSVLSSLIKKDPEQAEAFIDDFSDVYRYYLKYSNQDIVTLSQEVKFIESYTALLQKRFKNAYDINIKLTSEEGFIIPTALQLCIENAIKHNYGSTSAPLKIVIEQQDNFIIVRNNLNPLEGVTGSGIGNEYLKKQYQLQLNTMPIYNKTATDYIVKLPLIK